LPFDTVKHTLSLSQPDSLVLDLLTPKGWKAELTLVFDYIPRCFTCLQTDV